MNRRYGPSQKTFNGTSILRGLIIAGMLLLSAMASTLPFATQLDHDLLAERFRWAPREPSQKLIFIAIDKRSIDQIGVWPWPRSIYADLLDKLNDAGVGDIFLDVDFSTPSAAAEDGRLASALEKAGGGVLLPIFRQQESAGSRKVGLSKPIPELLANSWPVFANVATDSDGMVRQFDFGSEFEGIPTPTVASALSNSSLLSGSGSIDFSISPTQIPTYSLSEVLNGHIGRQQLYGRAIVVGASATELKDTFSVPVYGALAGPLIHILAAETLLQHRTLQSFDQLPIELLLAAILIVSTLLMRSVSLTTVTFSILTLGLGVEIAAFFVQKELAIVIATAVPWLQIGLCLVLALNERVDVGQMIAAAANTDARNSRRLTSRIIADSSDGIVTFDGDLRIAEISHSARLFLGANPGESMLELRNFEITKCLRRLVTQYDLEPADSQTMIIEFVGHVENVESAFEATITLSPMEKNTPFGRPFGGCVIIRDVTAQKGYERRLKRIAEEDELTGLLNRREFLTRLRGQNCAVALLKIDRFSVICATLGRDVGDGLLKAVADRLSTGSPKALLARIDRDIFAIASLASGWEPAQRANQILDLFVVPLAFGGMSVPLSVRVGVAPADLGGAEASLRAAESALDAATNKSGSWALFDPETALRQARSRRLEADMRSALSDDQFFLVFQPQIDLASGNLVGAEALVRWMHPELGLVSPTEFIPVAESSGLICEIGQWVLNASCIAAAQWPAGTVSVNVSALQFERRDVCAEVIEALTNSGLPRSRLCIELTESAFLDDDDRSIKQMIALREAGIALALDDFGTGYSSLTYLADLPLDKLKIDQSFIRRMTTDGSVMEIVKAVVTMAHGLGLGIVAEGVEGESERDILQKLGCETGQGYLFGKPEPADRMLERYSVPVTAAVA